MNNVWIVIYHSWCKSPDKELQKNMIEKFKSDFNEHMMKAKKVNISKNGIFDIEEEDEDEIE